VRSAFDSVSAFADKHHVRPKDILEDSVGLGRHKLEGLANKEFAEAAKNFAEAEQKKMDTVLQWRSLESKVRKEEAEARLSELKILDAQIELYRKLKELGVVLRRDANGDLVVLPLPGDCDFMELLIDLEKRRLKSPADSETL
jgi:hypothetical protein